MKCTINYPSVFKALQKMLGEKNTILGNVIAVSTQEVSDKDYILSEGFLNYYKTRYGEEPPVVTKSNTKAAKALVRAMREYYNYLEPDINYTTGNAHAYPTQLLHGYTSEDSAIKARNHVVGFISKTYNEFLSNPFDVKNIKTVYRNKVITKITKELLNRLVTVTGKSYEDVKNELIQYNDVTQRINYFRNNFGEDISIQNQNLLALYSDVTTGDIFEIAIQDRRISEIFKKENEENKDIVLSQEEQEFIDDLNSDLEGEADRDMYIATLDNKMGIYSDFIKHFDKRITVFLNSLSKLSSSNDLSTATEDNNNDFGIAETMDARSCLTLLLVSADCSNLDTMIASISKLAKSCPGYEALSTLADKCKNDTDFACTLYRNIGKTVVAKLRTNVSSNDSSISRSNSRASKKDSLSFILRNDFKQTALKYGNEASNFDGNKLLAIIKTLRRVNSEKSRNEIINTVVTELQKYCPSISESSIRHYIFNAISTKGSPDILDNLTNLINIIIKLPKKAVNVYKAYQDRQVEIDKISNSNKQLQFQSEYGAVDLSALQSLDEAYAIEWLKAEDLAPLMDLVNEIVDYTDVSIDLNDTNIHGNNNSAVINSSWLTYWQKLLNSEKGLEVLAKDKFQSSEYMFSNILVEKKDKYGHIINYGLFKRNGNEYVPTNYANEFLQLALYDGSQNTDNNEAVTFAEMSKGDYTATAFINYFKSVVNRNSSKTSNITYGTYFLRIMSDAPQMFTIRAPKYSTKGLWSVDPSNDLEVDTAISNLPTIDFDTLINNYNIAANNNNTIAFTIGSSVMAKIALGKQNSISLTNKARFIESKVSNGGVAHMLLYVPNDSIPDNINEGEYNGTYAIVKGKANVTKNHKTLDDIEFVGFTSLLGNDFEPKDIRANRSLYNKLKSYINIDRRTNGTYKTFINSDHPIFQQFRNAFVQELTDMATALDVMFEHDIITDADGSTRRIVRLDENNKPILKVSDNQLYDNYHKKKGKYFVEDGFLKYKLVGNVFTSSKFTLFNDSTNKVRNYGQEIIDENFNLLYGGVQDALTFDVDSNGKVSVTITEAQEDAIRAKFTEFFRDYIANSIQRSEQFRDLIENTNSLQTYDNEESSFEDSVEDFALNYYLMYMNFDDMFEGNNKYYKDAQTALKRAKEIQASGVPYATTDIIFDQNSPNDENSLFNFKELNAIRTFSSPNGIVMHKQFTGVTIKNTVLGTDSAKERANVLYKTLRANEQLTKKDLDKEITKEYNALKKAYKKENIEKTDKEIKYIAEQHINNKYKKRLKELEDKATEFAEKGQIATRYADVIGNLEKYTTMDHEQAVNYMLGFFGTKVNDAQSYITFDEFIRRIAARGQLHRYKPLIDAILDESKPVNVDVINEFVQVQKNFYYDIRYDATTRSHVPRQIKNAEFVLIPRFIKGTELEKVADLMSKYSIDQLNTEETSKAGKRGVLTIWDNEGNFDASNFEKNVNACKELYSYTHLYTQQETPQHMNTENKAGIQIMKKILDNIPEGHPLFNKKVEFFNLYSRNIIDSFNKFCKENGITLDANGNVELDYNGDVKKIDFEKLFKRFKEESLRSTLTLNSEDYFTLIGSATAFPDTLMPLEMSIFSRKAENIAQSAINSDITRQKLPGFHAAQITNVGWQKASNVVLSLSNKELRKNNQFKTFVSENHPDKSAKTIEINDELKNKFKSYLDNKAELIGNYANKLKYHPNGENYVEVMIPRSIFNFDLNKYAKDDKGNIIYDTITNANGKQIKVKRVIGKKTDDELLTELEDARLDKIIGYRIPTEGKQSICVMKIKGFIDETLGSTIIVPDDWVAQTGSDFDIDSVYAINGVTYLDKNGTIKKKEYKSDINQYDWFNYINKQLNRLKEEKVNTKLNFSALEDIIKRDQETFNENLKAIGDLFTSLPRSIQLALIDKNKEIDARFANQKNVSEDSRNRQYVIRLKEHNELIKEKLEEYKKKKDADPAKIEAAEENIRANNEMIDFLDSQLTEMVEEMSDAKKASLDARLSQFEEKAETLGLKSLDEFINQDPSQVNSRDRRNNRILDLMIDILSDNTSLEENLARSNFEDIILARKKVYDATQGIAEKRDGRSVYNFFDQADYQEDVMSGRKLKGFSVTRDTFNSICNTVHPKLSENSKVGIAYYPAPNQSIDDLVKELSKHFDDIRINSSRTKVIVFHDAIGWSKDNKNVEGKILTCYSSQTTAHILDAVKEGAIPNVNDLTFGVYKLIPDLGSNYETAVSFMMQPGISRIVNAYNRNKSIYSSENNNPVHTAIKEIAQELNILVLNGITNKLEPVTKYTPINKVIYALQATYQDRFNELFNTTGGTISLDYNSNTILFLDSSQFIKRISEEGNYKSGSQERIDQLLQDLGTVLQYNSLSSLSESITNIARVCNPDKFGAKQSIFATNKVFDDINGLIKRGMPLEVNGYENFLEAIYPGVTEGIDGLLSSATSHMASAYPPLYSFLKYSTALSVKVNRQLFKTQSPAFRGLVKQLKEKLGKSADGISRMTEDIDNKFKAYCINVLFKETPFMIGTPTIQDGKYAIIDNNTIDENRRIHGFGYSPDVKFKVNDINDVSEDEIKEFAKLSPAQKVAWIQNTFKNKGIFGQLEVNLFNEYELKKKGISSQTINFNSSKFDTNLAILAHYSAFNNTNPLIKLAAIDLIKYAIGVEGFNMQKNGISIIISNKTLLDSELNDWFLGSFNESLNHNFEISCSDTAYADIIIDKFIRSNYDINQIPQATLKTTKRVEDTFVYDIPSPIRGMFVLDLTNDAHKEAIERYKLAVKSYENNEEKYKPNFYVKLTISKIVNNKKVKQQGLYKVKISGDILYVYPISKLEPNEFTDFSSNKTNNVTYTEDFYEKLIALFNEEKNQLSTSKGTYTISEISSTVRQSSSDFESDFRIRYDYKQERGTARVNLRSKRLISSEMLEKEADNIAAFFENPLAPKQMYISSIPIDNNFRFNKTTQIVIDDKVYTLTKESKLEWILKQKYYFNNNENRENNPQIKEIVDKAINGGYPVNSLYSITEVKQANVKHTDVNPSSQSSDFLEDPVNLLASSSIQVISNEAKAINDPSNRSIYQIFKDKNIDGTEESIKTNLNVILENSAIFVQNNVSKILDQLTNFIKDEDNVWHSINSDYAIKKIQKDDELRKRFLKTILEANKFVKKYNAISNVDINSQNEHIRPYLKRIKDSIDSIRDAAIINNANIRYVNEFLKNISDNPYIQQDIISLMSGYHSTSFLATWIADTQENGNPLIQIVTKDVMANIRAADKVGEDQARTFRNTIDNKIRKAGSRFNMNHIIKDGHFVKVYNQAFEEKLKSYIDELDQLAIDYGRISEEYIAKKLDFDAFKAAYLHQPIVSDFYIETYQNDMSMFYGTREGELDRNSRGFRDIYIEYLTLKQEQHNIFRNATNGVLDAEDQEKYDEVERKITNLRSTSYIDPITAEVVEKPDFAPIHGSKEEFINNKAAATALNSYINKRSQIDKKYFKYVPKPSFAEDLRKNLQIVSNKERRNPYTGEITADLNLLSEDEEYMKAKQWLRDNARFHPKEEIADKVRRAFKDLRANGRNNQRTLSTLAKHYSAYDSLGYINPEKFTDEDLLKIKEELERYYRDSIGLSDKHLIKFGKPNETVYITAFYQGMTRIGVSNGEYIKYVKIINDILQKHLVGNGQIIRFEDMSADEVNTLTQAYNAIHGMKSMIDASKEEATRVNKFIKNNVEFAADEDALQEVLAKGNPNVSRTQLIQLLTEPAEIYVPGKDGAPGHYEYDIDPDTNTVKRVPRREIFGYIICTNNAFVDAKKTAAKKVLKENVRYVISPYFAKAEAEAKAKGSEYYNRWKELNYVYNPNSRRVEPLPIWTKIEIGNREDDNQWSPAGSQIIRELRDGLSYTDDREIISFVPEPDYRNLAYKEGVTLADNYNQNVKDAYGYHDSTYDNPDYKNLTDEEKEIAEYLLNTLKSYAKTQSAQRYINSGNLPSLGKAPDENRKWWFKQIVKTFGFIDDSGSSKGHWHDLSMIDYANDVPIDMPMLHKLADKTVPEKPVFEPRRQGEDEKDYYTRLKEFREKLAEYNAKANEVHAKLINNDYIGAIESFIKQAAHYNAIQDNKLALYHCQQMLDKMGMYVDRFGRSDLIKDTNASRNGNTIYLKQTDKKAQEQLANFIRRLVYDEWKTPHNSATKIMNCMQMFTSSKFMMMNVTGGIANVTVGYANILGEAAGAEYFNRKHLGSAYWRYHKNKIGYLAHLYDDKSSSVEGALIKFIDVVDFDERTGQIKTNAEGNGKYLERGRNLLYAPLSAGEHEMQNVSVLAMAESHKIFEDPRSKDTGRLKYRIMNESEFVREYVIREFEKILTPEQKEDFDKIRKEYTSDANKLKEIIWNRSNFVIKFAREKLDRKTRIEFQQKLSKIEEEARKEFNDNSHPNLMSQLELTQDGYLGFKADSIIKPIEGDNSEWTLNDAYKLLAQFQGRCISVNKKIHGVYDRIGAARLESQLFGSIVMQYHKHIYPGMMKRWRTKGYFNEERGSYEKGSYIALYDFLAMPFKEWNAERNEQDVEVKTLLSIQNLFKNYVEFFSDIKTNFGLLDVSERANIRRALNDVYCIAGGIMASIALQLAFRDKDKEGMLFNLALYEADRFVSETGMYTPIGLPAEYKTLWSSPIAAQTAVSEVTTAFNECVKMLVQGEDYEPNYQSGLYVGRNKIAVRLEHQLPIYRNFDRLKNLSRNNRFYRMGTTTFGFIDSEGIAESIKKW